MERKFNRIAKFVALGLITFILSFQCTPALQAAPTKKTPPKIRSFTGPVTEIIDGDTIKVKRGRSRVTVRLIGIDTPESKKNEKAFKDSKRSTTSVQTILEFGKRSAEFTEKTAPPGTIVTVEIGDSARDKYKRTLGWVFLPDGRMLNELLLSEGYAKLMTDSDNLRYDERLRAAFEKGRKSARGNWMRGAR
jgi:micrococcal nuclease